VRPLGFAASALPLVQDHVRGVGAFKTDDINDSICQSKEASPSEAKVTPTEWIGTSTANDNMIQQRNIHRRGGFPELSS
jgi:hypothetical protein